jgi:hypothetical protein
MALSQEEVDEFMAAEKVVLGDPNEPMKWQAPVPSQRLWRGAVEIDGRRVGEITLYANPAMSRNWLFKLSYRGEEVYQIHVRPNQARHSNPPGCSDKCPEGKVRAREHEHVYVEGLGCRCARSIDGLGASDHRAILDEFCTRARLRFDPGYQSPLTFAQMELL